MDGQMLIYKAGKKIYGIILFQWSHISMDFVGELNHWCYVLSTKMYDIIVHVHRNWKSTKSETYGIAIFQKAWK